MSARRRDVRTPSLLVVVALVVSLLAIGAMTAKPWKAQGADDQIRHAQADAIWEQIPTGSTETYRYTSAADAGWIPWGHHVTAIGRYYTYTTNRAGVVLAWRSAAARTGWAPACLFTQPRALKGNVYTKRLGASTSVLEIREDPVLPSELGIIISFGKQARPEFCAGQP